MKIEEIVASQAIIFARENNLGYSIRSHPSDEDSKSRDVEIEMLDKGYMPHSRRVVFTHLIVLDKHYKMASQKTIKVAERVSDRNAYLKFLEFMKKSRIVLTNDHEKIWRDNPHDYPVVERA